MNIIVSGWPGVGQSTLAIILAKSLGYTLVQGSTTFRYLGSLINLENTGADRIKADELLEPSWGPIFEKYMQWIVSNKDNIVTETDITGFFTKDNSKVYSIFLKAPAEVRKKRLKMDGRDKDIEYIENRDASLAKVYNELFNVDFLNEEKIKENYSIVIDNSELKIAEELEIIYSQLLEKQAINKDTYTNLSTNKENEEKFFWDNGKQKYLDILKENNSLPNAAEIIREIKQVFPEDIAALPEEIKRIVESV